MTAANPKPQSVEVALAVLTDTVRNMDKKLDEIGRDKADKSEVSGLSKRVEKIEGHLNKVVWIVIAAVIAAVLGGGYLATKPVQHPTPIVQNR